MTIDTKLSFGETAYFLYENKVKSGRVTRIDVTVDPDGPRDSNPKPRIEFQIDELHTVKGEKAFATKEALLASL